MARNCFVLLAFIIISCNNNRKAVDTDGNSPIKSVSDSIQRYRSQRVIPDNEEYLDEHSVRINGKLKMIANADSVFKILGKPGSSINTDGSNDICVSYYESSFKYAYIKGSRFELYTDTIVLSYLDLTESDVFLKCGNLILNKNTTILELAKFYPKILQRKKIGTDDKVQISIPPSKKPNDNVWILVFENGKLIRIEYYMPC